MSAPLPPLPAPLRPDPERDAFCAGTGVSAPVAGPWRGVLWAWSLEDAAAAARAAERLAAASSVAPQPPDRVFCLWQEWQRLGRPTVPGAAPRTPAEVREIAGWIAMAPEPRP